jgi:hypothetical protein
VRGRSPTLVATVTTLVAVPVGVELLVIFIREERYSLPRAVAVLAGVLLVLLLLLALRRLAKRLHLLLELLVLFLGSLATVAGIVAVVDNEGGWTVNTLGISTAFLGGLITMVMGYAIYLELSGAEITLAVVRNPAPETRQEFVDDGYRVMLVKFPGFRPAEEEEVVNLCRASLHPHDLHFVAYYVDGHCRFYLDVLDESDLNRFFRGDNRTERRLIYERTGRQLWWTLSRLNAYLGRLGGGVLIRTVLDVEEGGIFYYWIGKNVYLVGITLHQARVLDVDEKLRRLANTIGTLPRGAVSAIPGPRYEQVVMPSGRPAEAAAEHPERPPAPH